MWCLGVGLGYEWTSVCTRYRHTDTHTHKPAECLDYNTCVSIKRLCLIKHTYNTNYIFVHLFVVYECYPRPIKCVLYLCLYIFGFVVAAVYKICFELFSLSILCQLDFVLFATNILATCVNIRIFGKFYLETRNHTPHMDRKPIKYIFGM